MGMIGNYLALNECQFKELTSGQKSVFDLQESGAECLDIDKSWHAIRHMMGEEPPACYAVPLGEEFLLEECDLPYGVFLLLLKEVREAAGYLTELDDKAIAEKFDFKAMTADGVYPIVEGENAGEFFEYVSGNLTAVREFFQKAAERGDVVVFYIL